MGMGGTVLTKTNARSGAIRAVVTRADGTRQDLGLISYWHRNPLMRWPVNLFIFIKRLIAG